MARPNTRMTGTRETGPDIYASKWVLSNFLRNNTSKTDVDGIEYGLDGIRVEQLTVLINMYQCCNLGVLTRCLARRLWKSDWWWLFKSGSTDYNITDETHILKWWSLWTTSYGYQSYYHTKRDDFLEISKWPLPKLYQASFRCTSISGTYPNLSVSQLLVNTFVF